MNLLRTATLLGVTLLAPPPARADDAQDIVGIWEPVEVETKGESIPAEAVEKLKVPLTFKITKDKILAPLSDDLPEVGYTLTPGSDPKGIDTVDLTGAQKGEKHKGIYELNGDVLRLCIAGKDAPRPRRFTTKEGDEGGELSIKFQRKK